MTDRWVPEAQSSTCIRLHDEGALGRREKAKEKEQHFQCQDVSDTCIVIEACADSYWFPEWRGEDPIVGNARKPLPRCAALCIRKPCHSAVIDIMHHLTC